MDGRGNKDIKNHGFKTDREEPLNKQINIKVSESMAKEIKSQDNPSEFIREAIQEKLDKNK